MKTRFINIALLSISIIVSLLLAEGILRIVSGNEYYIWLPNLKYVFYPDSKIFPGIQDTSYLEINSLGLRANTNEIDNATNILVLGGSAAECLYLDQKETWPALIEKYLNENSSKKTNVFNGGRSGLTSQHHLIQIQKLLERNEWIDLIIVMEGLNDLQYAISFENDYKPKDLQSVYEEAFWLSPYKEITPFYRNTYLFKYLSKVKKALFAPKLAQDPEGKIYLKWRANRVNAVEIVDKKPNLDSSLSQYEIANQKMIDIVKLKNKKIIFVAQPMAWDNAMNTELSKLCWYGWIGKSQHENTGRYYSFAVLREMLNEYDNLLRESCEENKVGFIELNNKLEKDITTYYDDCHFNENGARKVAQIISSYLKANHDLYFK